MLQWRKLRQFGGALVCVGFLIPGAWWSRGKVLSPIQNFSTLSRNSDPHSYQNRRQRRCVPSRKVDKWAVSGLTLSSA